MDNTRMRTLLSRMGMELKYSDYRRYCCINSQALPSLINFSGLQSIFFGDFYSNPVEENSQKTGLPGVTPIEDDEDRAVNTTRSTKDSRQKTKGSNQDSHMSSEESTSKLEELEIRVSELMDSNRELKVLFLSAELKKILGFLGNDLPGD